MKLILTLILVCLFVGCGSSESDCQQCKSQEARAEALLDLLAEERQERESERTEIREKIINAINQQAAIDRELAKRLEVLEQPPEE